MRAAYDRRVIAAWASLALALVLQPLRGLPLTDAISLLQREGLPVIYSSALVKPEMRVEQEPRAAAARGKLEEILAPHGLRVVEGPGHELLVVAGAKPAPQVQPQQPRPRYSDEIVVTPRRPRTVDGQPVQRESLSHDQIDRMPNASDDAVRAVQRLPGVTGSEASAAVNIRGGSAGETAIAVDGLELSEPFHFKDFFNLFSTLDSTAIGRVDLMAGAFPAEWGDRIGGVIDMNLLTPDRSQSSSVSLGLLNSRLTTSGTTAERDTRWLITARTWYPDVILNLDKDASELINTDCYDVLGKVEHSFGERTAASLTFLGAYDDLGYHNAKPDATDHSVADEKSVHLWLTAHTDWSDSASVRSIVAVGRLSRNRSGDVSGAGPMQISDARGFNVVELKQDWRLAFGEDTQTRFGFDAKTADARYDYTRSGGDTAPVDTHLRPHEQSFALYAAERVPLSGTAAADVGLRWDRQSLIGGSQLSPRINVLWKIGAGSDVRLGWGRYYQSQRLNELQVEDGVTQFAPPEMAEQRTISFEHRFAGDLALRVEAFDKPMTHVRPRFENVWNPIDVFPEAQDDRVMIAPSRSRASGVEMRLAGSAGERASWWAGYVRSRAVDTIDGRDVPRSWDQPQAASAGLDLELPGRWNASFAGAYHTGWPATPLLAVRTADGVALVAGERNSERLPAWFRIDARAAKSIQTRRGLLWLSVDVFNLTNHQNVCCISDATAFERADGTLGVTRVDRSLIPIFPSFSARWIF